MGYLIYIFGSIGITLYLVPGIAEIVMSHTVYDGCALSSGPNWMLALGIGSVVGACIMLVAGILAVVRDYYTIETWYTIPSGAILFATSIILDIYSISWSIVGSIFIARSWTFCSNAGHIMAIVAVSFGFATPLLSIIITLLIIWNMDY